MNRTDSQIWEAKFLGEGSIDAGGPFRESLSNLMEEIESDYLPLLVKTANNKNDHGFMRECWTLNPNSTTPTHAEMFKFMGCLLGFTIRSKSAMNWHFPPVFWKRLLGEKVEMSDLDEFDTYTHQCLKDLRKNGQKLTPEMFNAGVEEYFVTYLSNGTLVELCPNGKETPVTHENYEEFIDLVVKTRLSEADK